MSRIASADLVQQVRDAFVAVVDRDAALIAATTRDPGTGGAPNVVPFNTLDGATLPVVAFTVVDATRMGGSRAFRVPLQLAAIAEDEATCNAMLGAIEDALVCTRFLALEAPDGPIDVVCETFTPRGNEEDGRVDADVVLLVTA